MADDYTPTTDDIRSAWHYLVERKDNPEYKRKGRLLVTICEADEEFDRWLAETLAAHDAQKRAEWEAEQREQIASEIEAEWADTSNGLYYDAYINGLRRAIEIARGGR